MAQTLVLVVLGHIQWAHYGLVSDVDNCPRRGEANTDIFASNLFIFLFKKIYNAF